MVGLDEPSMKSTIHASADKPGYGEEDQNVEYAGVFGKAVWSIVAPEVTVRSTRENNSLSLGRRKPDSTLEQ
jgi:hypothetical protein